MELHSVLVVALCLSLASVVPLPGSTTTTASTGTSTSTSSNNNNYILLGSAPVSIFCDAGLGSHGAPHHGRPSRTGRT